MQQITDALKTFDMATVLVVDDYPSCLELLRLLVRDAGHAVLEASDGLTALAMARTWKPDVILLDIDLGFGRPGGLEVARQLKRDPSTSMIVIVAVSALVMPEEQQRMFDAGCDAYVSKPFDCVHVQRVLGQALVLAALLRRSETPRAIGHA
jgi:two-component system, cell cycle response regulator DivK